MMLRLFDSLGARLLLLLVGGLAAAQTLSAIIGYHDRKSAIERIVARRHAQRVVDLVHMLDGLGAAERAAVARTARNPVIVLGDARLDVHPSAADRTGSGNGRGGQHLIVATLSALQDQIAPPRPAEIMVKETAMRTVTQARGQPSTGIGESNGWAVVLRSELRDGTPFSAHFEVAFPAPFPLQSLALHLAAMFAVTAVLVVLGVRWVTRPLGDLADAADRLGHDIEAPPLVEAGASELRRAARAFNSMQGRLSRYLSSRVRALSAISHDLKTPLTRLRLRMELVPDAVTREAMLRDVADLEQMVASTLDFIRGLENTERSQPTDIDALLESVCVSRTCPAAGWKPSSSYRAAPELPAAARAPCRRQRLSASFPHARLPGGRPTDPARRTKK